MFRVNGREENIYTFTVTDTDDFNVTVELGMLDEGILLNSGNINGTYSFSWRPEMTPNITELSFVAMDSSGAATIHSPIVQFCACFNGGQCTIEGVLSMGSLVQTLTCMCDEGKMLYEKNAS